SSFACAAVLAAASVAAATAFAASPTASGPAQYQTMCAIGKYTNVTHRATNSSSAENFMRSAKPPTISAGVMQAKVIWKQTNTSSGITTPLEKVPVVASGPTPQRNALEKPPTKLL